MRKRQTFSMLFLALCGALCIPSSTQAQLVEDSDTICVYYDKIKTGQYEAITELYKKEEFAFFSLEKHPYLNIYRTAQEAIKTEKGKLIEFYKQVNIPWEDLFDKPLKEWPGVLKVENGRVVGFALPNLGLRGSITHLAGLHKLEYLDLSNNRLKGSIPFMISKYLKVLILSNNKFQGNLITPLNLAAMDIVEIDGNGLNLKSIDVNEYLHLDTFNMENQIELPSEAKINIIANGGIHFLSSESK